MSNAPMVVRIVMAAVTLCVASPRLHADGTIAGYVRNGTGQPVQGAEVQVKLMIGDRVFAYSMGDGSYAVAVAAGSHRVVAWESSEGIGERENIVVYDGQTTTCDLDLVPASGWPLSPVPNGMSGGFGDWGYVGAKFQYDKQLIHGGIDAVAATAQTVNAAHGGEVKYVGRVPSGTQGQVWVRDGTGPYYADFHTDAPADLKEGDIVYAGQALGQCSWDHVHLQVVGQFTGQTANDFLNPLSVLSVTAPLYGQITADGIWVVPDEAQHYANECLFQSHAFKPPPPKPGLPPKPISVRGRVDIVAKVASFVNGTPVGAYAVSYSINGIEPATAAHSLARDFVRLDGYSGAFDNGWASLYGPIPCTPQNSWGNLIFGGGTSRNGLRPTYYVVTNCSSSNTANFANIAESNWDTTTWPNGKYRIVVSAWDYRLAGNPGYPPAMGYIDIVVDNKPTQRTPPAR